MQQPNSIFCSIWKCDVRCIIHKNSGYILKSYVPFSIKIFSSVNKVQSHKNRSYFCV